MLTTFLQGIWSKVVVVGIILATLTIAVLKVFSAGQAKEKLSQVQETLKENKRNAEIAATIDSVSTDAIRDRLRNDWSSR